MVKPLYMILEGPPVPMPARGLEGVIGAALSVEVAWCWLTDVLKCCGRSSVRLPNPVIDLHVY